MRIALLALAAVMGRTDTAVIPHEFQRNGTVWVQTMGQGQIERVCGTYPGFTTVACADQRPGKPYLYMPNPCTYPEVADIKSYAHLMCHEIAHTQGWRHVQ